MSDPSPVTTGALALAGAIVGALAQAIVSNITSARTAHSAHETIESAETLAREQIIDKRINAYIEMQETQSAALQANNLLLAERIDKVMSQLSSVREDYIECQRARIDIETKYTLCRAESEVAATRLSDALKTISALQGRSINE